MIFVMNIQTHRERSRMWKVTVVSKEEGKKYNNACSRASTILGPYTPTFLLIALNWIYHLVERQS